MQRSRLAFWLSFFLAAGVGAFAASFAKGLGALLSIVIGIGAAVITLLVTGIILTKSGR